MNFLLVHWHTKNRSAPLAACCTARNPVFDGLNEIDIAKMIADQRDQKTGSRKVPRCGAYATSVQPSFQEPCVSRHFAVNKNMVLDFNYGDRQPKQVSGNVSVEF
ncbi:MAG: hypothetical protein AB1342_11290 [Pseudomonadota bacterium]